MKRLTQRQKAHQIKRQHDEELKRSRKKHGTNSSQTFPRRSRPSGRETAALKVKTIKIPEILNLDSRRQDLFKVLDQVRGALIYGRYDQIFLNFNELQDITSEAALILLAEIDRSMIFSNKKLLGGNHPANPVAASLLRDMGYFKFFKVPDPPLTPSGRVCLEALWGNQTDGSVANRLIEVFESQLKFAPTSRRALYEALIECMQNVRHHAYPSNFSAKGRISGRWWMTGFSDNSTGEVTFSFLDQGVGIPTTLQHKWKQLLNTFGRMFSETELILEAIVEHRSRLKSIRRGNGLSVLRSLVEMAPEGRFRICSRRAHITFLRRSSEPIVIEDKQPFDGTFISWTLFPTDNANLYNQPPLEGISA